MKAVELLHGFSYKQETTLWSALIPHPECYSRGTYLEYLQLVLKSGYIYQFGNEFYAASRVFDRVHS